MSIGKYSLRHPVVEDRIVLAAMAGNNHSEAA
jgi:hypothetical protein